MSLVYSWFIAQFLSIFPFKALLRHCSICSHQPPFVRTRALTRSTLSFPVAAFLFLDVPDYRPWKRVGGWKKRNFEAPCNQAADASAWRRLYIWRIPSSMMLRRVALVRTDVSEERSASIIMVTRIGELGTTLAVTSNHRTLRRNTKNYFASVANYV
jgi:hypothetical protein